MNAVALLMSVGAFNSHWHKHPPYPPLSALRTWSGRMLILRSKFSFPFHTAFLHSINQNQTPLFLIYHCCGFPATKTDVPCFHGYSKIIFNKFHTRTICDSQPRCDSIFYFLVHGITVRSANRPHCYNPHGFLGHRDHLHPEFHKNRLYPSALR